MTVPPSKDLTDERKYKEYGAYHWKTYISSPKYRSYVDQVIKIICKNETRGTSILDIGCGDGLFSAILKAKTFKKIQGIDINPIAVKLANDIGLPYVKQQAIQDVTAKYRVALLLDVFEHLEEPTKVIKKLSETISQTIYLVYPHETAETENHHHVDRYSTKKLIRLFCTNSPWRIEKRYDFLEINKTMLVFKRRI